MAGAQLSREREKESKTPGNLPYIPFHPGAASQQSQVDGVSQQPESQIGKLHSRKAQRAGHIPMNRDSKTTKKTHTHTHTLFRHLRAFKNSFID